MAQAGALPLAGLTAWQTLVDTARVQAGDRVLIHAAAGGVGHLAVQIAKTHGAYVIGTAREKNHETLSKLGVDELIDYRASRFEDMVTDVDVVLDLIGGENALRSLRVLRPNGLLVAVPSGTSADLRAAAATAGVKTTGFLVEPDQVGLDGLSGLVGAGQLRVIVERLFPLAEASAAHEAAEHGHLLGKIGIFV